MPEPLLHCKTSMQRSTSPCDSFPRFSPSARELLRQKDWWSKGNTYRDTLRYVPPDTPWAVVSSMLVRYHHWLIDSLVESAYEHPHDFIPERWYSQPQLIKDRRAFSPFGIGRTSSVGKQLALAQLRLVAARLLSKYRYCFAESKGIKSFENDMKDQLTAKPGKLILVFEHL
jgi:hypothetical protein